MLSTKMKSEMFWTSGQSTHSLEWTAFIQGVLVCCISVLLPALKEGRQSPTLSLMQLVKGSYFCHPVTVWNNNPIGKNRRWGRAQSYWNRMELVLINKEKRKNVEQKPNESTKVKNKNLQKRISSKISNLCPKRWRIKWRTNVRFFVFLAGGETD